MLSLRMNVLWNNFILLRIHLRNILILFFLLILAIRISIIILFRIIGIRVILDRNMQGIATSFLVLNVNDIGFRLQLILQSLLAVDCIQFTA